MDYTPQFFHPWHNLSAGEELPPNIINGVIEIPHGSRAKYELDKQSGMLMLDRVLYSAMYYPANYGFIPQSYCDDGDPLDILVLSQVSIVPMCMVPARVIGVMQMLDNGQADDKIIAVADKDMSLKHVNDVADLPQHLKLELKNFFEDYKKLEKKSVLVEEFQGVERAKEIVYQALADYKSEILPKRMAAAN